MGLEGLLEGLFGIFWLVVGESRSDTPCLGQNQCFIQSSLLISSFSLTCHIGRLLSANRSCSTSMAASLAERGPMGFTGVQDWMDHEVVDALAERDEALKKYGFPDNPKYEADPGIGCARLGPDGKVEYIQASPARPTLDLFRC